MSVAAGGAAGPSITTVGSGVRGIAGGWTHGAMFLVPGAVGARLLLQPRRLYSLYKYGTTAAATYYQLTSLLPVLGPEEKVGIRAGTEPTTKPLGEISLLTGQYGPAYMDRMPMLYPDIGIMAVPNDSSRWIWESKKKSTRGEHTVSSGTPFTRKTMRGGLAQRNLDKSSWAGRKTRSRASSKKPAGMTSRANRGGDPSTGRPRRRTPKALPYRKGGCPLGYRYDIRRKMCVRVYK